MANCSCNAVVGHGVLAQTFSDVDFYERLESHFESLRLNDVGHYEMLLIGSDSLDLILCSHCSCIEAEFGAEDLNISYGRYEGENKRMAICRVSPNASPPGHLIRWPHNFDNLNLHTLPQFFSTATTP